jgi:hypothetical protein
MVWQMDSPQSELQGGGPPRLRRVLWKSSPFTRLANTYISDEGFSVEVLGRTGVLYEEGPRRLFLYSEYLVGPRALGVTGSTIKHWEPPYAGEPLGLRRHLLILDNIRRAFRAEGINIGIDWPTIAKIDIPIDPEQGYPSGNDLFYECLRCGDIVPTTPTGNTGCACDNLQIDVDNGRVVVSSHSHLRLFALDTRCQCYEVELLEGEAAQQYADQHLVQLRVDVDKGETTYRCASTGHRWIMDHPHGELQGGPLQLHRL